MYAACQPCCVKGWDLLICCAVYDDLVTFAEAFEKIGECLQVRRYSLQIGIIIMVSETWLSTCSWA